MPLHHTDDNLLSLNLDIGRIGKSEEKTDLASFKWRNIRREILNRDGSHCCFCGIHYNKYLICFHLDKDTKNDDYDNLRMACRPCYMITHLNFQFNYELILCWSKISQIDIVRKTVNYAHKKLTIPEINRVDADALRLPLSLFEFLELLSHNEIDDLPPEMSNYKIFFTPKLDITFLNPNADFILLDCNNDETSQESYLIDNDSDEEEYTEYINFIPCDSKLPEYKFSDQEKRFLNINFDPPDTFNFAKYMENEIKRAIFALEIDNNEEKEYDRQYHTLLMWKNIIVKR